MGGKRVGVPNFNAHLDMPPQMDYFYHESRVPSACGLTREDELDPDVISCMLVGDGAVGKTSMIISYISNGYPAEYQQTGFDVFSGEFFCLFVCLGFFFPLRNFWSVVGTYWLCCCSSTGQVQVEGSPVKIQLLDTAGQVKFLFYMCFQQYFILNDVDFVNIVWDT